MNLRCLTTFFVLLAILTSTQLLSAANRTGMSRQEIKAIPITERPNRPGHFYGNTVRRTAAEGTSSSSTKSSPSVKSTVTKK